MRVLDTSVINEGVPFSIPIPQNYRLYYLPELLRGSYLVPDWIGLTSISKVGGGRGHR